MTSMASIFMAFARLPSSFGSLVLYLLHMCFSGELYVVSLAGIIRRVEPMSDSAFANF